MRRLRKIINIIISTNNICIIHLLFLDSTRRRRGNSLLSRKSSANAFPIDAIITIRSNRH